MAYNLGLWPRGCDPAVWINQESATCRCHPQNRTGAVRRNHFFSGVRDHGETELELINKLLLSLRLICTYAHHEGVEGLELRTVLFEVLRFVGSTRGVRARVEVDGDPLSSVVAQLETT